MTQRGISRSLVKAYLRWFYKILQEVEREGVARVMLADDLIGEFYLGEDNKLHWRRIEAEDLEVH